MIYKLSDIYYKNKEDVPTVDFSEVLGFIKKNKTIALDIETCFSYKKDRIYKASKKSLAELNCFEHKILLLQLGTLDCQYVIDVRCIDIESMILLGEALKSNNNKIVGHNLFYDLHWLKHHFKWDISNIYDTFLIEKLLTNGKFEVGKNYGLAVVYNRRFNINIDYPQLNLFEPIAPKKTRDNFPTITEEEISISHITYCRYDLILPLRIRNSQMKEEEYKKMDKVIRLELKYLLVLIDMKLEGISLHQDKWEEALSISAGHLFTIKEALKDVEDINWNSPKQKLELYSKLGVELLDRKGKASASVEALKLIASTLEEDTVEYTVTELLMKFGAISKQVNSYGTKFLKNVNKVSGRIHSDIQQLMISGRTSSTNPNLQNIPRSNSYRNAFYKEEGLSICDYASMEIRRVAEVANETTLIEVLNNGLDAHLDTAEKMFGKAYMDDLFINDKDTFAKLRSIAKTLNFSILFGVSSWKLSNDYKVSPKVAQEWIDSWFKTKPNITKWLTSVRSKAIAVGYVQIDSLGRKAFFSGIDRYRQINDFLNYTETKGLQYLLSPAIIKDLKRERATIKGRIERQAGNFAIQGSCATCMKTAQILAKKEGLKNVLQVHDELLIVGNETEQLKVVMEQAWNIYNKKVNMPLVAEYSSNWKK
jgi:DNA polymerase I-like protein with 3'-5' exonuclease and polymerase domains